MLRIVVNKSQIVRVIRNSFRNYAMSSTTTVDNNSTNGILIDSDKLDFGYKQSFKQWLESKPLSYYEDQVLRMIPFYPDGDATRESQLLNTVIDKKGNFIHEFCIENKEQLPAGQDRHIVIIHGYGASLGFFYKNFDDLSRIKGVKIHAIDLLGFGLSSRPKFPKNGVETVEEITKSEDFFVDSLEEWRKKRNLDKFVLVGHSLGGYLSSCYTLKHQDKIEKLVLISPVGVERSDYQIIGDAQTTNAVDKPDAQLAKPAVEGPEISNEVYLTQQEIIQPSTSNISDSSINSDDGSQRRIPKFRGLWVSLWERHVSPFTILRTLGPVGPKFISRWSFARFGGLRNEDTMKMHMYAYKTFIAKGSGEYALTRLLAPGALARMPMLDRLPGVLQVPSFWLYGDHDWMSRETGKKCVDDINKMAGKKSAAFKIVENAGHHVYLDNPTDFDRYVKRFINWN